MNYPYIRIAFPSIKFYYYRFLLKNIMSNNSSIKLKKSTIPYGNWPSTISSELIVRDSISLDEPILCNDTLYYIERRPQESGRCVIIESNNQTSIDMLPAPYSARSRVHEYGGGCYCIGAGNLFFINDNDQDIYSIKNKSITRITIAEKQRFADISYDDKFNRLVAICETHDDEVTNTIVSIDINNGEISTLEHGNDFYASPKLNSSGTQLCWQTWNHPNMPWDGNQLWLATLDDDGLIKNKAHIAGDDDISVFQPQWSPDDILHYISDDTGWWHLYRYSQTQTQQLTHGDKEFGAPQWVFAQSNYAFIDSTFIICSYQSQGKKSLATLLISGEPTLTSIESSWQEFSNLKANADMVCFIGASGQSFPQLITTSISNHMLSHTSVIKQSSQLLLTDAHYSVAQPISFINRHQQTVHANYYPPTNPEYCDDDAERPPLITICHGGPTGQASVALDPKKQFWTSRGFALLDVNYSGSTGYGRDYRTRLNTLWGVLDVEDCCDAALHAVTEGLADIKRLIIRGSSAGGYSVLSALTFQKVFSAGASYYGISELTSLATDTHKFESRYLDRLIGPYPEDEATYLQRSPINSTENLNCPVIFFQGVEDRVVPKEQAEKMFDALSEAGVTVAAQYYEGEQHGFRKAESIMQSLDNELSFYRLIFKLTDRDKIKFKGEIKLQNIGKDYL